MKTGKENEDLVMLETLLGAGEGAIERSEARGQQRFCNSTDLPTKVRAGGPAYPSEKDKKDAYAVLEKMGIKVGQPHGDDPLFMAAELPEGWMKVASDNSMHNDLVDDRGRVRAGIFYKAAFYDRKAHMDVNRRFSIRRNYEDFQDDKYNTTHVQHRVLDANSDTPPFSCEPVPSPDDWPIADEIDKKQREACEQWLQENYPNWEDYTAYWDE